MIRPKVIFSYIYLTMKNPISFSTLLLSIILILGVAFTHHKWSRKNTEATLSWDVMGYYLYLPSTFIYNDITKLEFKDQILKTYQPTTSFYQAFEVENGNYVMKYSIGLSLLMLPFFLIGHLIALVSDVPADGFSMPYQMAISYGSIVVGILGLILSRLTLLRYFPDRAVALTLVLLCFGTNYLNYVSIDFAMTHNYIFTLYAFLIYQTIKWYEGPSWRRSVYIGIALGLIGLTRPNDLLALIIPLAWGLSEGIPHQLKLFSKNWKKLLLAVLITSIIGSIQLLYWKFASGHWIVYSYEDQGFSWLGQHFRDCFFSYRKGWLIYTPMMIFSLLGFVFLYRKHFNLFWPIFLSFLVNTYIIFSWDIWWYGGSFGQRAMVQSYAMLLFPMTAFVASMMRWKWFFQIPIYLMMGFFIALNLFQTYQIHSPRGGLDPEFMTEAYYWRIFGKLDNPKTDRFLMDTDEDFLGERKNVNVIFEEDFESFDSTENVRPGLALSGAKAGFTNSQITYTPKLTTKIPKGTKWIRVSAAFYTQNKEWEMWRMPKLWTQLTIGDQVVKDRFIRVSRILPEKEWMRIHIDVSIPDESVDQVAFFVDHSSSWITLYTDDFRVETFE